MRAKLPRGFLARWGITLQQTLASRRPRRQCLAEPARRAARATSSQRAAAPHGASANVSVAGLCHVIPDIANLAEPNCIHSC